MKTLSIELIDAVIKELESLKTVPALNRCDLGDLANSIGAVIGGEDITDEDKEDFLRGLKHGYSLADGTHWIPMTKKGKEIVNRLNEEFRKKK